MLRNLVTGLARDALRRSRDRLLAEAVRLREAGELQAAAALLRSAVRDGEPDTETRLLLADICRALGDTPTAERIVRSVLAADPDCADACLMLGALRRDAGDPRGAAEAYLRALALAPENLVPRIELAVVLIGLGQASEAEALLRYVLNRDPDSPEAHGNLGIALLRQGRAANALPHFERAASLAPANVLMQNNLALAQRDAGRLEEAERLLQAARVLEPDHPTTLNNLALTLADLGRAAEARAAVEPVVRRNPGFTEARCTFARTLQDLGEREAALAEIERALEREPANAEARMLRAFHFLSAGDFERGWDEYQARTATAESPQRAFPFPEWHGEPLGGKSVLIYAEQGIGDEIMFAGCFGEVMAAAGRVVIECDPRLAVLFRRSFPAATVFPGRLPGPHPWLERAGAIALQVPAGTLPLRYRRGAASFPRHAGYLRPDPDRVAGYRARLARLPPGRKVGLAWRGGIAKTRRVLRSIEPHGLAPLLDVKDVHFVSLQHAVSEPDLAALAALAPGRVHHWPEALGDADETAALMAALECVVTVCSYIVHLGGALGLPVRVMVPASPEWRYLHAGAGMPWYPSVRLIRQRAGEDWSRVVGEAASELRAIRNAAGGRGSRAAVVAPGGIERGPWEC